MIGDRIYQCPWCGHPGKPLNTAEHRQDAIWTWAKGTDADVARNPMMCEECHRVGGREDFEL